jgi:CRISPR-associated protein (TIGR02710 family)
VAKTVLILTVGTTAEPLINAVDVAAKEEGDLEIVLLYGRPFAGQRPDPFTVAGQVRDYANRRGIRVIFAEIADPEDIEVCLQAARMALRLARKADRVIVNYTGGTKPMSAAAVHAALSEPFAGGLELRYVGGERRDETGRVTTEAMRVRREHRTATQETVARVIELLQAYEYEMALALTSNLPDEGRPGFLKRAVPLLHRWDRFDYTAGLAHDLCRLADQAGVIVDDPQLGGLAATVRRLCEPASEISRTVRQLGRLEQGQPASVGNRGMCLIAADVLENAARCVSRGRWAEAILRCYRGVEVAVQGRLISIGVNPWKPEWESMGDAKEEIRRVLGTLPQDLGVGTGMRVLEVLEGRALDGKLQDHLRDLQQLRNRSMLEHGFLSPAEGEARRCAAYAEELVECILPGGVARLRVLVSLSF